MAKIYVPTELVPMGKTYAVVDSHNVRGGFYSAATYPELDAVDKDSHFKPGILAYVTGENRYYKFNTNGQWTTIDFVLNTQYTTDIGRLNTSSNLQNTSINQLNSHIDSSVDELYKYIDASIELVKLYVIAHGDNMLAKYIEKADASINQLFTNVSQLNEEFDRYVPLVTFHNTEKAFSIAINECYDKINDFEKSIENVENTVNVQFRAEYENMMQNVIYADVLYSPNLTKPSAPTGNPGTNRESAGWYAMSSDNFDTAGDMKWRAERTVSNGVYQGNWVVTGIYVQPTPLNEYVVSPSVFRVDGLGRLLTTGGQPTDTVSLSFNVFQIIDNVRNTGFRATYRITVTYSDEYSNIFVTGSNIMTGSTGNFSTPFYDAEHGQVQSIQVRFRPYGIQNTWEKIITLPFLEDSITVAPHIYFESKYVPVYVSGGNVVSTPVDIVVWDGQANKVEDARIDNMGGNNCTFTITDTGIEITGISNGAKYGEAYVYVTYNDYTERLDCKFFTVNVD